MVPSLKLPLPAITLVIALVSIVGNVYSEYNRSDKDLVQRVAVLENARQNDHESIAYIRGKLDDVGADVQRLIGALLPNHK